MEKNSIIQFPIQSHQSLFPIFYRRADLSSIKKKIESGSIRTVAQFQRHILLVFTNAMMYNSVNSTLYELAKEMMLECNQDLQVRGGQRFFHTLYFQPRYT